MYFFLIIFSFIYKETILYFIIKPCIVNNKNKFYFICTNLTEIFYTYFLLCIYIALIITIMYCFFHIYKFIEKGLFKKEKYLAKNYLKLSFLFFLFFFYFLHNYMIPFYFFFFLNISNFSNKIISFNFFFELKFDEYINFYYYITIYWSLFFCQLFTFIIIVINLNLKKIENLIKSKKKYIYFFLISLSTIVSTPEVINQISISLFNIITFELIVIINLIRFEYISNKKIKKI